MHLQCCNSKIGPFVTKKGPLNLYSASILAHCSETNTMSCSLEDRVFVSNLAGIQFVILVDESCLNSLRWPKHCLSVNRRTMFVEL